MKKRAAFFDIDGTIWDYQNFIPESTRQAIRKLRANDCLTFLCSGRSRAFIREPALLELGFDGIVSGCGTMVEYEGETIFSRLISKELAQSTLEIIRTHGFRPILEGPRYLYLEEEDFVGDAYVSKVIREMGEQLLSVNAHWGSWEFSKLSCATPSEGTAACYEALSPWYDAIVHNSSVVELVPKGFHKGTGILKVCELLGIEVADTYAFGDSVNDLGMFAVAGTAVCMGNGSEAAKAAADYVTASLYEDGIWKACRSLGLI